jgi:hypothetical protein|tara:strand:+ start:149 stop:373 length:225 start_codon:yes stop_codon:yes gene_type:complete
MFKSFLPFASKIIKDAVKSIPDDSDIGERLIEICLVVLAKAVKSTKTDIDDQLFEQVAKAIRNREVDTVDQYVQ